MAQAATAFRIDIQDGDVETRVRAVVDAMLARKGRPAAGPGQDLREAGLSSLDLVNLMLAVEGEFDLFVPQSEMTPANFRSAASIANLIGSLS